MKFCLSSRQPEAYLKKADEIKVENRDIKSVPDLFEKYPEAMVILEESFDGTGFDWKELKTFNTLSQGRLMLCLAEISSAAKAKEIGIPFYMGFPTKTFYEIEGLMNLGATFVRIDAPLFFKMNELDNFDIPKRLVVNLAYCDMLPREDGVNGVWIRPEDLHMYDEFLDSIEFGNCDLRKEQALFRIYAEEHEWPGELGMIVDNLNHSGLNRMIHPDVTKSRMNCGQRCVAGSMCKICYRALSLADRDKVKDYLEATSQS